MLALIVYIWKDIETWNSGEAESSVHIFIVTYQNKAYQSVKRNIFGMHACENMSYICHDTAYVAIYLESYCPERGWVIQKVASCVSSYKLAANTTQGWDIRPSRGQMSSSSIPQARAWVVGVGTPILGHGREVLQWWPPFSGFSIWLGPYFIPQHQSYWLPLSVEKIGLSEITFTSRDVLA